MFGDGISMGLDSTGFITQLVHDFDTMCHVSTQGDCKQQIWKWRRKQEWKGVVKRTNMNLLILDYFCGELDPAARHYSRSCIQFQVI